MNKRHLAFTLTETLVMMAVVGILATITAVSLQGLRPDRDALLIKASYGEIAKTVNALVNDEFLYHYADAQTAYLPKTDFPVDVRFLLNKDELMLTRTAHLAGVASTAASCTTSKPSGKYTSYRNCSGTTYYCTCSDGTQPKAYATQSDGDCFDDSSSAGICCGTCTTKSLTLDDDLDTITKTTTTTTTITITETILPTLSKEVYDSSFYKDALIAGDSSYGEGSYSDVQGSGSSGGLKQALNKTSRGLIFCNRTLPTLDEGTPPYTANNKFAYNFSKSISPSAECASGSNTCTFKTGNNVDWYVVDSFTDSGGYALVYFNTSGTTGSAKTASNTQTYAVKVDTAGGISLYNNNDTAYEKAVKVLSTTEVRKGKIK